MKYTVKQLADVAGVTPRTLHYYDQIGLLRPSVIGNNGYRYYGEEAVLRLQQIMFFRELDFSLAEIQAIIDGPDFDLLDSLQSHKRQLQQRLGRLSELIQTIDRTMLHLQRAKRAQTHDLFVGFDEARQAHYEQEIAERYGEGNVNESRRRWANYSAAQQQEIKQEGNAIYLDFAAHIGDAPSSPEVQRIVARWHDHMRYFYEPTREIMMGLAEMYATHPDFVALYAAIDPALPDFLRQAILHYCQAPAEAAAAGVDEPWAGLLDNR
jgi:DNA-binding transcriptional MerR regulator